MTTMQRFPEGLGFACLALLLALPFTCAASTTVSDWQSMLQGAGYATETPEQIIEAYNSEKDWFTRIVALELLVQRVGIRAIPALSNALDDAQVEVRHKAAELLHRLGDDGGLVQMQYDFDLLSYKCGYVPRDAKPEELEGVQVNRGQYSFE